MTKAKDKATTDLAREFDLYEYPWPKLLGADRRKWERVARLVDDAGRNRHKRECSSLMADGRTRQRPARYEDDHAESHRRPIRMALIDLLEAGMPSFLVERDQ